MDPFIQSWHTLRILPPAIDPGSLFSFLHSFFMHNADCHVPIQALAQGMLAVDMIGR